MDQILNLKNTGEKNYHFEESIKTLRTNMQFCGSSLKTIMFTSSLPNEGKSEITFSVAASLGSIGKKVLMIDADIRKSVLIKRYEIKGNPNGLSQYLSGQKSLDEICYATDVENFDIILAGPYSPNPAELLEDSLFRELLEKAKERYDYIIIDTPPMANLIDGAIIANQCDGAVIVIESGTISYHLVQKVKGQLEKSGCRILGAVLNRVDKEYENGYYKKYYGKYYGKYYRNTGGGYRGISLWTEMGNNIYEANRKQEESKP
ncbi:CpsD/CapB family tyrosine-protein kinase [Enterocloster citroniae]|uniref:CpsD/CapB family tyrosine-protein kinase n=1 Tax=Enterocloster citroniae TaxID=358743 RepID=UPI0034A3042E